MSTDLAQVDVNESKALKESMSFVVGKGLPIPKNWSGDLEKLTFPDDMSKISMDQLGEALSAWSSVMAYVQFEVARADIERTARQNRYNFESKKLLLSLYETKMSDEQRRARVHVETATLRKEYEIAKAKFVLMESLLSAYSQYYQALSRELSRRGISGADTPPVDSDNDAAGLKQAAAKSKQQLTKQWACSSEPFEATGADEDGEVDDG